MVNPQPSVSLTDTVASALTLLGAAKDCQSISSTSSSTWTSPAHAVTMWSSRSDEAPIWQSHPSKEVKLAFVKGDKWQLSVDLTSRPDDSPLAKEEMRAGAEFRITPRISVGGSLSVGSNSFDETLAQFEGEEIETGIRLRSAFKF